MAVDYDTPRTTQANSLRYAGFLGLGLLALAPVLTSLTTGAIRVPFLDDWAYLRIADTLAATGHLQFLDWNDVNLVGLLPFTSLSATVFGHSILAFRVVGLVAYALALWGIWKFSRLFLDRRTSVFSAAVCLVFPTVGYLAATLMTDVAAFACQMWCLVFGIRALRSSNRRRALLLTIIAVSIGLLGFTIRQQAIIAPVAILGGLLALPATRRRSENWALAVLVATVAVTFTQWRSHVPLGGVSGRFWPLDPGIYSMGAVALLCGAFLLPAIYCYARTAGGWDAIGASVMTVGLIIAGCLAGVITLISPHPFNGNAVTRVGACGDDCVIAGERSPYYPTVIWYILIALMVIGLGLISAIIMRFGLDVLRHKRAVELKSLSGEAVSLLMFLALSAMAFIAAAVFAGTASSRYAAAGVTVLIPLLLRETSNQNVSIGALPVTVTVFLAVITLAGTWDAQAFGVAKWRAGEWAVDHGMGAESVDAGFEWVGFHYPDRIQEDMPPPPPDGLPQATYLASFPRIVRSAVVLDITDQSPGKPLASWTYPRWFGLGHGTLGLYTVQR